MRPIVELAQAQPLLGTELSGRIDALLPDPAIQEELRRGAISLNLQYLLTEPATPAPLDLLRAETSRFVAALAAQPKVIAANREPLARITAPQKIRSLEDAVESLSQTGSATIYRKLRTIASDMNLADTRTVQSLRGRLDRIFENIGAAAESPEVLAGRKLPSLETFRGERILKTAVQDGIIRLETDTWLAEVGIKHRRGTDIAQIAKGIRADIRAGIRAGRLPEGKYSVHTRRFAGGESINIDLTAPLGDKARVQAEAALQIIGGRYMESVDAKGPGEGLRPYTFLDVTVSR